jgi:hypothetical protein
MSNHLSIATVTATLQRMLTEAVSDIGGAEATIVRPDASNTGALPDPGVNIFLYQVTPNTAWRNADLPTRNPAGQTVQRPRIGLDLHYLFTFHGDENDLEPQRVMGSVIRAMHARPVLTPEMLQAAIDANPLLAGSNLPDEVERVKFTSQALNLEEMSKIWSVFLQTPYVLSMVYVGTVVLIEAEEPARRVLPVRTRVLNVFPFQQAVLEAIVSEADDEAALSIGDVALLQGQRLGGSIRAVLIGEAELTPDTIRNTEIRVVLAGADLRAGVQGLQVAYTNGAVSNTLPLVLRPVIDQINQAEVDGMPVLQLTLTATVGTRQRAVCYLNQVGGTAAHTLPALPHPAETTVLTFDRTGVASGDYLVRVEVGGAESLLQADAITGLYNAPVVTIP